VTGEALASVKPAVAGVVSLVVATVRDCGPVPVVLDTPVAVTVTWSPAPTGIGTGMLIAAPPLLTVDWDPKTLPVAPDVRSSK